MTVPSYVVPSPSVDQCEAVLRLLRTEASWERLGEHILSVRTTYGRDGLYRLILEVTDQEGWFGERCWIIDGVGGVVARGRRTTSAGRNRCRQCGVTMDVHPAGVPGYDNECPGDFDDVDPPRNPAGVDKGLAAYREQLERDCGDALLHEHKTDRHAAAMLVADLIHEFPMIENEWESWSP